MKLLKRSLMTSMILTLIIGALGPSISFAAEKQNNNKNNQMVDVTISSNDEETIIAQVPKSHKEEYLNKLKDPKFKKSEIEKSKNPKGVATFSSPDIVKYMGRSDVIEMVDSIDDSFDWSVYLSNPLSDYLLGQAVAAISKSSIIGVIAGVLGWGASYTRARQEKWWKDSAIMILRDKITFVKLTVTYNPGGYPKAYKRLTRI